MMTSNPIRILQLTKKLSLVELKNASLETLETKVINGIQSGNPRIADNIPLFFKSFESAVVNVNRIAKDVLPSIIEVKRTKLFSTGLPNHRRNTR